MTQSGSIAGLPPATSANLSDILAADQANPASPTGFSTRGLSVSQLAALTGPVVNVMNAPFNAKGGGNDDTVAIQAALDSVNNRYSTTVLIPSGSLISNTLSWRNSSIRLMGLGWGNSSSPISGSYLRWNGPAGQPMLDIRNCWGTHVKSLRFIGNAANPPSEAIRFTQDTTPGFGGNPWRSTGVVGTQSRNSVEDVWIGTLDGQDPLTDASFQFTNGITFAGTLNGDNCTIKEVVCSVCAAIGINVSNPNAGLLTLENVGLGFCPVGIYANAQIQGTNVNFEGCTIDMQIDTNGNIDFYGVVSEAASQHAKFLSGLGYLSLRNSSFQLTANLIASGKVIDASGTPGQSAYINLENPRWLVNGWTGSPTPLISVHASGGTTSNIFLRIVGPTGLGPANIDVGTLVGQNDGRTIIYEPSGIDFTPLVPHQHLSLDFNRASTRSFKSWWNDFPGAVDIYGGGLNVRSLFTPVFPSATNSLGSGSTTYSYQVTALTYDGETAASAIFTCTNGPALGVNNHNTISWGPSNGAYAYNVYGRIAGSIGLLATVTWDSLFIAGGFLGYSWVDNGSASPGVVATTLNTTGSALVEGPVRLPGLIQVGTPNNANAAAAGVPLRGLYVGIADPAIVYMRTA